ncbi:hypothetical protein [Thermococcus chitonophagus]|uniref:hypothetical protein n=1 Tax=Thermococcus chitonophagus TaxID=54262 RepID=UPI0012EDBC91|nr:hypothetical protein [Thermococcus chitonophagus]
MKMKYSETGKKTYLYIQKFYMQTKDYAITGRAEESKKSLKSPFQQYLAGCLGGS